jgi:hypothetical protein
MIKMTDQEFWAGHEDYINKMIDNIARLCHEVNRAYCKAIGDTSQVRWEDAPEWQKNSARIGVKMHLNNPTATAEDSHISWLADKKATGWVWGPVKDVEKKEHPCFCDYNMLPQEQRVKDYLFKACVETSRQTILAS